jgi:hypothetical protein
MATQTVATVPLTVATVPLIVATVPLNKALLEEVLFGCAVAVAAEAVATGPAQPNPTLDIYNQVVLSLRERRVNFHVKDELEKRHHMFQPHLELNPFEDSSHDGVLASIGSPTTTIVDRVEKFVAALKTYSRNEAGAAYAREKKTGPPSGTYDDKEILGKILFDFHMSAINGNFEKWVRSAMAKYKTETPEATSEMRRIKEKELYASKKDYYDLQKAKHLERNTPAIHIVWVICGQPGKNMICLQTEAPIKYI